MNVADLPQTDVTATTVDIRTDATSLPASAEAQSELRKVTVEQSIIESLGLTSFEIMAVESLQDDAPIASVAPITATEEAAATEETPTVTVSASAPAPMYRVVDKEISQSTAVSTEEGAHSSQFSQGEANGSLPSPRSPKKGWPNSSVKQSVSRSLTGRGPESIYKKPAHSYSSLITEAVRMSIKGQMTLNEIYCWLIEKFPYFRAAGTGWKNSIRHTLSTNQKFVRVPRPAKEPGKGAYWTIRELEKVEPLHLAFKTHEEPPPAFFFQKAEREEENATAFYNQFTPISPISPDGAAYYYSEPSSAQTPHMPELYYRGMENQMMDHYPQVYLPAFTAGEDGSPRLTHNPTSPQPVSVNDMYYGGFDPIFNYQTSLEHHVLGSFPAPIGAPRIVLSRDSSFLDDWTANNSIVSSTAKLTPFGMSLTAESTDMNKGHDHPQTPDFKNNNNHYQLSTSAVKVEPQA